MASVPAPTEAQIFLEENWNQLALLALALTGTVLFFIAVKKASPAHTRIPDVVREYQNFLEERIRVTEAHSKALDEGCGLSPAEQRADEDVVEELRRLAMEDPETVSKVLEEYAISIQADPPIEISRTQKAGSK